MINKLLILSLSLSSCVPLVDEKPTPVASQPTDASPAVSSSSESTQENNPHLSEPLEPVPKPSASLTVETAESDCQIQMSLNMNIELYRQSRLGFSTQITECEKKVDSVDYLFEVLNIYPKDEALRSEIEAHIHKKGKVTSLILNTNPYTYISELNPCSLIAQGKRDFQVDVALYAKAFFADGTDQLSAAQMQRFDITEYNCHQGGRGQGGSVSQ